MAVLQESSDDKEEEKSAHEWDGQDETARCVTEDDQEETAHSVAEADVATPTASVCASVLVAAGRVTERLEELGRVERVSRQALEAALQEGEEVGLRLDCERDSALLTRLGCALEVARSRLVLRQRCWKHFRDVFARIAPEDRWWETPSKNEDEAHTTECVDRGCRPGRVRFADILKEADAADQGASQSPVSRHPSMSTQPLSILGHAAAEATTKSSASMSSPQEPWQTEPSSLPTPCPPPQTVRWPWPAGRGVATGAWAGAGRRFAKSPRKTEDGQDCWGTNLGACFTYDLALCIGHRK
mmetsp:Transcript_83133/g.164955  ORF Transcript_83133/g.164955 Transcript_83133/m.164955 type:complete len:300 (-) Transcript_83133:42-941(-)|eukprot:CAMPEP_0172801802 /NCGR_PEP_ID=MMETSP1075-20121228/3455_1 /TAXON_ID=2916 /ORGANISM="Ceratium fusus, Strain PA161109" /LENGTH=299 /DNA_ID=CAMNT_0013639947 /DNA_START=76 /DNA_END=975 /DNA_ORIENTATION=-